MDHNQLTTFDRIVHEGSFSRAAHELHIAQPTISARVQPWKRKWAVRCSHADRRRPVDCAGGQFFTLRPSGIGCDAGRDRSGTPGAPWCLRGRITIGSLGSLTGGLLAPALVRFQATHPTVECYARSADHLPLVRLLYDGVVELAVIPGPVYNP